MNKDNVFDNLSQEDLASIVQVIEDSARKANARILSRNLHPNDLSEAGAAESFSKLYSEKLHWTKALGWMCWDGRQWVQSDEKAKAAMITYSNDLLTDAKNEMAESIRQSETGDPSKEAKEYLRFVADLYQVENPGKRVDDMIEKTGLTREYKKKIGALSKGYRQRVT